MGVDIARVARRYITEIWSKGDLSAVDELVDENIVVRDTMGTNIKGRDQLREMVKMMQSSFTDNTFEVEDVIVSGDRVVIQCTWRGTHRGDFFGIQGTGRTVTTQAVDVLRLTNGKVVEDVGYMDSYSMFQQLGVLPEREKLIKTRPSAPEARPPA